MLTPPGGLLSPTAFASLRKGWNLANRQSLQVSRGDSRVPSGWGGPGRHLEGQKKSGGDCDSLETPSPGVSHLVETLSGTCHQEQEEFKSRGSPAWDLVSSLENSLSSGQEM